MDREFLYSLNDNIDPYLFAFFIISLIWVRNFEMPWKPRRKQGESILFFLWERLRGKRPRRFWPSEYIPLWKNLGIYGQCCTIISVDLIRLGTQVTKLILVRYPYSVGLAQFVLGICFMYALYFLFSFNRLLSLRPNAMRDTFFSLAFYPYFCLLLPYLALIFGAYLTDLPVLLEYTDNDWLTWDLSLRCIIAIGWTYYLSKNKEVRRWHSLQALREAEDNNGLPIVTAS